MNTNLIIDRIETENKKRQKRKKRLETQLKKYIKIKIKLSDLIRKSKDLKQEVQEDYPDYLQIVKIPVFETEKDLKELPTKLLKLDHSTIGNIYKSPLGGEEFLEKYGLTVREITSSK